MSALPILLLLAAAPLGELELQSAIKQGQRSPAVEDRIEQLSRLFLGMPYAQYPLGEESGVEPQPRWRSDMVDCQTYVETMLAKPNATTIAMAKTLLDDIRYSSPQISFSTRNHFTEAQCLQSNEAKGYLREETSGIDPAAPTARLVLRREQWSRVKGLERLATADIPEGSFSIRYLPLAEARERAAQFAPGSVMLIVRAQDPQRVVRVSHMALVVRTAAGLVVRHASFGWEKKVIEEPIAAFLDRLGTYREGPVGGVALGRALGARGRAVGGPRRMLGI